MKIFIQSRVRNYLRNMCKQMNKMTYNNDFSIWQTLLAIYPKSIFSSFINRTPILFMWQCVISLKYYFSDCFIAKLWSLDTLNGQWDVIRICWVWLQENLLNVGRLTYLHILPFLLLFLPPEISIVLKVEQPPCYHEATILKIKATV